MVTEKKTPEQFPPGYGPIAVADASHYIGKTIKVVDKDGVEHEGTLLKAGPDRLVLEMWKYGGRFAIEMKTAELKSLQVYR